VLILDAAGVRASLEQMSDQRRHLIAHSPKRCFPSFVADPNVIAAANTPMVVCTSQR